MFGLKQENVRLQSKGTKTSVSQIKNNLSVSGVSQLKSYFSSLNKILIIIDFKLDSRLEV